MKTLMVRLKPLKPTPVFTILKVLVNTSKRTPHFTITAINWLTLFTEIKPLFNPLKPKLVCPYLKENTTLHRYSDQLVNAV
jgi:hypothetical protein